MGELAALSRDSPSVPAVVVLNPPLDAALVVASKGTF
jgi:hypothetical protein